MHRITTTATAAIVLVGLTLTACDGTSVVVGEEPDLEPVEVEVDVDVETSP